MATLLAHLKIIPGKEAEFETVARMLHAETVKEPDCTRYEFYRGAEPGHYYCMENFKNFRAFLEHQASPHHEAAPLGALIDAIRVEWIDPVQGASTFGPTDHQPAPEGATEIYRTYATKYFFTTKWWDQYR